MSTPFHFIRNPGGESDPQFDRHTHKKGNTGYFSHEKDGLKASIELS